MYKACSKIYKSTQKYIYKWYPYIHMSFAFPWSPDSKLGGDFKVITPNLRDLLPPHLILLLNIYGANG